jgi:hypothetical protein
MKRVLILPLILALSVPSPFLLAQDTENKREATEQNKNVPSPQAKETAVAEEKAPPKGKDPKPLKARCCPVEKNIIAWKSGQPHCQHEHHLEQNPDEAGHGAAPADC